MSYTVVSLHFSVYEGKVVSLVYEALGFKQISFG